ncbi:MAG: hypothetical protein ACK4UO_03305 [Pseudolabrys sp.]
MPKVWRFRMRAGRAVDHSNARTFAVKNGVVGAGWPLPKKCRVPDRCKDLERYLKHARATFPDDLISLNRAANIIGRQIRVGDYGWTYLSHTGEYWCCKITGDFEYRTGGDFDEHDIHMVRRCKWVNAGPADAVPGVIRRAFSTTFGTVSGIVTDAATAIDTAEILHKKKRPQLNGDLFALAGDDELEDLVALYLQGQGWRIIPSTAKRSTANYEFILVHSISKERAGIQVKGGGVKKLPLRIADDLDYFFVFMADYIAEIQSEDKRIRRINRNDILEFARNNWFLLPRALQTLWPIREVRRFIA